MGGCKSLASGGSLEEVVIFDPTQILPMYRVTLASTLRSAACLGMVGWCRWLKPVETGVKSAWVQLKAVDAEMWRSGFKCCYQLQLAPLQHGGCGGETSRSWGRCQRDPPATSGPHTVVHGREVHVNCCKTRVESALG